MRSSSVSCAPTFLNYAIGLIALLIGLASLLIFAFRPDRREYGYFALFTVCMAIYGIYWTDLKQVVADMPVVYGIGLIFSLHFEAVGILGFLKEILPREFRTATTWLLRANVLYAAIGISLAASRLVPLGYSVIMVNVVIALDILVGLPVIGARRPARERGRAHRGPGRGCAGGDLGA